MGRRAGSRIGSLSVVGALLAGACDGSRPPLVSCNDDLRGVYQAGGRRWMILDQRATLEAYPLFDDVTPVAAAAAAAVAGLELGPRVLELSRTAAGTSGHVRRRYMRGAEICVAKVPVRITACAGDALDVVLADPDPPLEWAPSCVWSRPGSSRRERWIRE